MMGGGEAGIGSQIAIKGNRVGDYDATACLPVQRPFVCCYMSDDSFAPQTSTSPPEALSDDTAREVHPQLEAPLRKVGQALRKRGLLLGCQRCMWTRCGCGDGVRTAPSLASAKH